jgi:hypothetical protein
MRTSGASLERSFLWSAAISGVFVILLVVYPLLVRLFLPAVDDQDRTRAVGTNGPSPAPRMLSEIIQQARDRMTRLPKGVTIPADLAQRLYANSSSIRNVPIRKALEDSARLHAIDMVEHVFISETDQEGLGANDRVSMLDRTGLYAGIFQSAAMGRHRAAEALAPIAQAFDQAASRQALRLDSYNSLGIACAEKEERVACVRVLGMLEAELVNAVPETMAAGGLFDVDLNVIGTPASSMDWKLMTLLGNELKLPSSSEPRPRVPPDFRGEVRLAVEFRRGDQSTKLDGPMVNVK